jgi:hypothetical protein
MTPRIVVVAAAILFATPPAALLAQGRNGTTQRWPGGSAQSAPAEQGAGRGRAGTAEPRRESPAPQARASAEQRRQPSARSGDQGRQSTQGRRDGQRTAEPRRTPPPQRADRGDNDRDDRRYDSRRGRTNIYIAPRLLTRSYYPRRSYYYDPYYSRPLYLYGYGGGYSYYGRGLNYDIGEVRIDVRQRDAQVYVDGYYAGTVDDFDGTFQSLRLESGTYHIEVVLDGYEPLEFDVRLNPDQKITYRGDMRRIR